MMKTRMLILPIMALFLSPSFCYPFHDGPSFSSCKDAESPINLCCHASWSCSFLLNKYLLKKTMSASTWYPCVDYWFFITWNCLVGMAGIDCWTSHNSWHIILVVVSHVLCVVQWLQIILSAISTFRNPIRGKRKKNLSSS
jgi:hypothetical protein